MERRLDFIIRLGLLLIVFLAPLPFASVEPWAFSALELGVAIIGLLWLYRSFLFPATPVVWSPIFLPPIGFLLLMVLQTIPLPPGVLKTLSPRTAAFYGQTVPGYSPTTSEIATVESTLSGEQASPSPPWLPISQAPAATRVYLLKGIAFTLFLFLTINSFQGSEKSLWLFHSLVIAGTLQASYGLLEYLSGHQHIFSYHKKYYTQEATGTFINRNHFAGYLEMTLLVALGLLFSKLRESNPAWSWRQRVLAMAERRASLSLTLSLCIGIMAVALVLSYSRAGIVFGLSAAGAFFLAQVRKQWSAKRLALVTLFALAVMVPAYGVGYWKLTGRYGVLTQEFSTQGGRLTVWKDSSRILRDFPTLGTGIGSFQYVFPRYREASVAAFYDYAHNDYLQVMIEGGLPGLLLLCWGAYLLARLWLRGPARETQDSVLRSASGLALLAIGLHELVDFGLQIPANTLTLALVVGCLVLVAERESRRAPITGPLHV